MTQESEISQTIGLLALVIDNYDRAIDYYVGVLGFELIEDTTIAEENKRWVVISPPGNTGSRLLLAEASSEEQASRIGNQTGGRVFLFLQTNDFARDYAAWRARGVEFIEAPRSEAYGEVAVFRDLYGNQWDLLEPSSVGSN